MPKKQKKAVGGNGAVPPGKVRVRTYRHGLGDCHLLSFTKPDGSLFHMLIDCGVVNRTPKPVPLMTRVVVAPDSFKGTFSASEVAAAIGRGLGGAGRPADLCPAADGAMGLEGRLLGRRRLPPWPLLAHCSRRRHRAATEAIRRCRPPPSRRVFPLLEAHLASRAVRYNGRE